MLYEDQLRAICEKQKVFDLRCADERCGHWDVDHFDLTFSAHPSKGRCKYPSSNQSISAKPAVCCPCATFRAASSYVTPRPYDQHAPWLTLDDSA